MAARRANRPLLCAEAHGCGCNSNRRRQPLLFHEDGKDDKDERSQVAEANSEAIEARTAENEATDAGRSCGPRAGTKLARVVGLLQRDCGATLEELIEATGWLPHTTRAALTGLRKRGYAVTIDRSDKERGSTYRARSDETLDLEQAGSPSDTSAENLNCAENEEQISARRDRKRNERRDVAEAAIRATSERVILFRRRRRARAKRSTRLIASLADLDAAPALSSMAQPFGRDTSRPFAALAAPEGSRLSASSR